MTAARFVFALTRQVLPQWAFTPMSSAGPSLKKSRLKYYLLAVVLVAAGVGAVIVAKRRNADKAVVVNVEKAVVKTITQIVSAG